MNKHFFYAGFETKGPKNYFLFFWNETIRKKCFAVRVKVFLCNSLLLLQFSVNFYFSTIKLKKKKKLKNTIKTTHSTTTKKSKKWRTLINNLFSPIFEEITAENVKLKVNNFFDFLVSLVERKKRKESDKKSWRRWLQEKKRESKSTNLCNIN